VLLFVSLVSSNLFSEQYFKDIALTAEGGGAGCAACTIITSLVEQMSELHSKPIEKILDEICMFLPEGVDVTCEFYVETYGKEIIHLFNLGFGPDLVCHGIDLCSKAECRMYPARSFPGEMKILNQYKTNKVVKSPKFDPWEWLQEIIKLISDHFPPLADFDGDRFATISPLRGANWRGRDCNDGYRDVYPGRKTANYPNSIDHNCNGIKGSNNQGISYENLYCNGTGQLGIAVIGDSAGAHFSIPPEYMSAKDINETTYTYLLEVAAMEVDWPHRSAFTGFDEGPLYSSLYKYLRNKNKCNHRDFQNLGVNGARSGAMKNGLVYTLKRDPVNDNPLLLVIELVGNDVCSPHTDFDHMTQVDEFKSNIIGTLDALSKILPNGSHIVFIGLADGRVLWNELHNRNHPIGVSYKATYDFLNCLAINPCWVWMNSNETIRNIGSERAYNLTQVYKDIVKNKNYPNFDMVYYDFPFKNISSKWIEKGGEIWQLIEPIDGFHPSQPANSLMADALWESLNKDRPNWFSPNNPRNNDITNTFGNQDGY
jgi:acyloxyacyl hydrolase